MTPTPEQLLEKMSEAQREREAIVAWLRRSVGMEAGRMILASGIPGGTRTERVKSAAFARGCAHAVGSIIDAIERGDHLAPKEDQP